MGSMYKESHSGKIFSRGRNLNTIMFSIVVMLVLGGVVPILSSINQRIAGIYSYIAIIGAGLLCYYVINSCIAQYEYLLIDDELVIKKCIGQRCTVVYTVNLRNLEYLRLQSEVCEKNVKPVKFYVDGQPGEIYTGCFKHEGNSRHFSFKPSNKLMEKINREMTN